MRRTEWWSIVFHFCILFDWALLIDNKHQLDSSLIQSINLDASSYVKAISMFANSNWRAVIFLFQTDAIFLMHNISTPPYIVYTHTTHITFYARNSIEFKSTLLKKGTQQRSKDFRKSFSLLSLLLYRLVLRENHLRFIKSTVKRFAIRNI